MVNPILQNLTMNSLKPMINMVKTAQNPQAMLEQLARSNPQLKNVMDMVNANGGDARSTFYKMAGQKGIDPDTILKLLR